MFKDGWSQPTKSAKVIAIYLSDWTPEANSGQRGNLSRYHHSSTCSYSGSGTSTCPPHNPSSCLPVNPTLTEHNPLRAKFVAYKNSTSGELKNLWHGTQRVCKNGDYGSKFKPCQEPSCSLCCILRHGFKIYKTPTTCLALEYIPALHLQVSLLNCRNWHIRRKTAPAEGSDLHVFHRPPGNHFFPNNTK
ncbi:hypothetical protein BGZ63DRAFT_70241 [Mariannaea sp. PMI_226]|nr:hypothetical protein BGZ63DRAFT_70241 [Mariannaea sp. PMI_226]